MLFQLLIWFLVAEEDPHVRKKKVIQEKENIFAALK